MINYCLKQKYKTEEIIMIIANNLK